MHPRYFEIVMIEQTQLRRRGASALRRTAESKELLLITRVKANTGQRPSKISSS